MSAVRRLLALCVILAVVGSASGQCARTFQQCDFFFLYNRARPPVFRLSPQQVNRLLSPPVYHRSGVKVISANSNGNMSCNGPQCSPIFYFTSPTVGPSGGGRFPMAANCLAHHPIPTYVYQEYRLKCILLYMDNLVLPRVGWLNPNDNKQEKFPESRRCVVFYTRT
ncbi:unnamed protein product [Closterium sp. NIES-54]